MYGDIDPAKKNPDTPRPFKTPFVPVVPILGILTCLVMMFSLPADTWLRLLIWLAIGFVIYFGYGKKHSKLRREQPPSRVYRKISKYSKIKAGPVSRAGISQKNKTNYKQGQNRGATLRTHPNHLPIAAIRGKHFSG